MKATLVAVLLLGASCATVEVDGHTLFQKYWVDDAKAIQTRAAFDLKCETVKLSVLATGARGYEELASQVGVAGCGRQAVYVLTGSGWVMNTADQQLPRASQAN